MKVAIIIALLGLSVVAALARSDIPRSEFKFTPGKIQTYEYRGRLVNGIPKLANQYSGLQVECKVVLQPVRDQQVVMKLDDIRVSELPHHHTVEHYERIGSNNFDGVYSQNKELTQEYQRELVKPIRFTYIQGKVHGFEADAQEEEWSINMKKSILALFQLDLTPSKIISGQPITRLADEIEGTQTTVLSTIVDPITGKTYTGEYSPEEVLSATSRMPLVYPVYEESFQGICETQYQVDSVENVDQLDNVVDYSPTNNWSGRQQQQDDDVTVLNVTKTINFKNCLTDPSVSYDQHVFGSKSPVSTQSWQKNYLQQQRLARYNAVPESIKSKYSNVFTSQEARDNVAAPIPVDRYSFIKYNITQQPISSSSSSQQSPLSVIEGVLAEGKIKYQADGDELVSISHQKLTLLYVQDEQQSSPIVLKLFQQIGDLEMYTTIQCEMTQQKMKYYNQVMRQGQMNLKQQLNKRSSSQWMVPYANSASWYSLVADEEDLKSTNPNELVKQAEQLLEDLVDDVQSDVVSQSSKKAGHRVVQLVHIVANLPKAKLVEIYERIVKRLPIELQQQLQQQQQQQQTFGPTIKLSARSQETEEDFEVKIMRKLFLDSLPLAGTKESVRFILELIEKKCLSALEAKELVESIPQNIRYPEKEIIDGFVRLTQVPFVREHQTLKMSASIACAKMIANAYERSKDFSFKSTVYETRLPAHLREDISSRVIADEADPRNTNYNENTNSKYQSASQQAAAASEYENDSVLITEQDILKYVKIFKSMLEKSRDFHDRVTYIETLAHMKVAQVLPVLQPYISGHISLNQCVGSKSYDDQYTIQEHQRQQHQYRQLRQQLQQQQQQQQQQQSSQQQSLEQLLNNKNWSDMDGKDAEECNFLRTIAIYACAHIAQRGSSNQIVPMVLPVFDNTYEPYQIRIAAFTVATLGSTIDEHTLERIASQMWREPSKQVASFVVGTLDTLANMTQPKMAKIAYKARKACESMPKEYLNTWRYSWLMGGDHYNNEIEQGFNWVSELVKSNVSSIPRAGYFHFGHSHGPAAQSYDNQIELGWTAKGLEQFMEEYLAEEEGSILATIFQQIFASSEDIEKYYTEARDTLFESQSHNSNKQATSSSSQSGRLNNREQQMNHWGMNRRSIRSVNGEKSEKLFGNKQQTTTKTNQQNKQQHQQYFSRDGQSYSWESSQEEPKLGLFTKLFDQTSYLALDKQQMKRLARDFDDYITDMGKELVMGGKLTFVKMLMPSSMWSMVPSQIGMPVFVTHRRPIIVSVTLDGQTNQAEEQQQQTSKNSNKQTIAISTSNKNSNKWSRWTANTYASEKQMGFDHLSVYVHPKMIVSSFRFMFTVDQAQKVAYGVQTEKSQQLSVPMIMSVGYSQPRQLVSFSLAPIFFKSQPEVEQQQFWSMEVAKTFVGDLKLVHKSLIVSPQQQQQQQQEQSWLGDEKIIRARSTDNIRSPVNVQEQAQMRTFERAYNQKWLGLELVVKGASDETEFDWTFNMENKKQHRESGPFSHFLHILDELTNRPCKYQEVFGYLRPDQLHKQPVYKFELALQKPIKTMSGSGSSQYKSQFVPYYPQSIEQLKKQSMRSNQHSADTKQVVIDDYLIRLAEKESRQTRPTATTTATTETQQQKYASDEHTVVYVDEQDQNKVCFSMKPVKKCQKNETVLDVQIIDTPYTCLSTESHQYPQLSKWIEEAKEKVLHQMEDMRKTYVRPTVQARMCSVY